MAHSTDGCLGINLTETVAGTGTNSDQGNQIAVGTKVKATDGGEYIYVHASAAVAQYDAVGIDENFEAAPLTKAMADDGWFIGFSQVAASDNDFFWVATKGSNIQCNVLANCAADVVLYTTATAGSLDDTSTSQTKIDGVVAAAGTTPAAAVEIIASHPKSTTF